MRILSDSVTRKSVRRPHETRGGRQCLHLGIVGGRAAELLFEPNLELLTTERTTWEVKKYLPRLAAKTGMGSEDVLRLFELIPVRACQSEEYEVSRPVAQRLIGARDPFDVDILALALETGAPLWSNDSDFEGIENVILYRTKDIFDLIGFIKRREMGNGD